MALQNIFSFKERNEREWLKEAAAAGVALTLVVLADGPKTLVIWIYQMFYSFCIEMHWELTLCFTP